MITGQHCQKDNLGDENGVGVKRFMVKFFGDLSITNKLIRADEAVIAPHLSKTSEEKWRDNLKKGQLVDAMSRTHSWFKATVIEPDPREDAVQKMAKIGFREYSDYGDKSDEMGNYFGFSANLDEHIGHHSLRIMPPGTCTSKIFELPVLPTEKFSVNSTATSSTTSTSAEKPVSKLDATQDESDMKELFDSKDTKIKYVTERRSYAN